MPSPDASLVIVNYRTAELTDQCLSLAAAAANGLAVERVVVDNASGDGSAERLRERHPDVTVVEQAENLGFGGGVNAGFAATRAPYVVVLNPDTEPEPGALAELVEHLRRHPEVAVAAPVLLQPGGGLLRSAHHRFPTLATVFVDFCVPVGHVLALRPSLHPHEIPERETAGGVRAEHVNGAAMAIRRSAFEAAGGFDEGFFMYLEETEFQQRLRRLGWAIDVVPQAHVRHMTRAGAELSAITERYLPSIYRYMGMQGHSARAVDAVLVAATTLSRLTLATIARLSPSRRAAALELLAFHRSVAAYVRARRRAP